jgi:hypothetical protein
MWGAILFLLMFLVIDPTTRDFLQSAIEQACLRLAVEAPLPYFLLIVLTGSALISALIMMYWPRTENDAEQTRVVRRYQGRAATDTSIAPRRPAFGLHLVSELACLLFPIRARRACERLWRNISELASLKRLPGA